MAAIQAGGGDPGNEEKLRVSPSGSVKIGDNRFGLLEFYPHVKRGKRKKTGPVKMSIPHIAIPLPRQRQK